MKRIFSALIVLWSVTTMAGLPPTTLSGEASATKPTTFAFKTPNYQATQISGIQSRIETGNKNLLQNPSYEHSTIATGWTNTGGGTPTTSTTNLQDGAASVTTTSTGAWTFYQDVTLYASGKSGQEAEASIWVYSATASADLWLCPRVNGASVTASVANGCHQYTNLGSPQKLTVFMLYGATSTGIEIKGSGAITYILDDAYLGDRRPMANGITTTPTTSYTPTLTGFGTTSPTTNQCKYKRIGNEADIECFFTTGTVTATTLTMTLPLGLNIDSSKIIATNTSAAAGQKVGSFAQQGSSNANGWVITGTGTSTSVLYFANTFTGTTSLQPNLGTTIYGSSITSINVRVPILEWSSASNAFTTKCDDPRQCETVFSASLTGTPSVSTQSTGSAYPWISSCTSTGSGSGYCNLVSGVFTVAPHCVATINVDDSGTYAGNTVSSVTKDYFYFRTQANPSGSYPRPQFVFCQKQGADYTASKLTQQIVQMRGVPVVPGGERVDTFSFNFGTTNATTACSASPCSYLDQIGSAVSSVSRSGTGTYSLNTSKTYTKLKCSATGGTTGRIVLNSQSCANCSALTFTATNAADGTAIDTYGTLYCQGSY